MVNRGFHTKDAWNVLLYLRGSTPTKPLGEHMTTSTCLDPAGSAMVFAFSLVSEHTHGGDGPVRVSVVGPLPKSLATLDLVGWRHLGYNAQSDMHVNIEQLGAETRVSFEEVIDLGSLFGSPKHNEIAPSSDRAPNASMIATSSDPQLAPTNNEVVHLFEDDERAASSDPEDDLGLEKMEDWEDSDAGANAKNDDEFADLFQYSSE